MIRRSLYTLIIMLAFQSIVNAQTYNDGRISLTIWVHKVWSSADCSESLNFISPGSEPVFKNIRVRVPSGSGYDYSPANFGLAFDSENTHRWLDMNRVTGSQGIFLPTNPATEGALVFFKIYNNSVAPTDFEWMLGEAYEKDLCGTTFTYRSFNANPFDSDFCLDGDDNHLVSSTWQSAINPFRSTPAGVIGYVQSDVLDADGSWLTGARDDRYAVQFAFRWDWVTPLPALCPSTNYQDGAITVQSQLIGLWSDSDYDIGASCIAGVGFSEDLRLKFRAKDNLSAYSGWVDAPNLAQSIPEWNVWSSPVTNNMTWNYTTASTGMESFSIDLDVWEEDGCGADNQFNTCSFPTNAGNDDDAHYTGSKTINWRDSPPNTWNYLDLPLRNGTSRFENWTLWIRYYWSISNPTATIVNSGNFGTGTRYDRILCLGTPTTITANTTNATYFQWQVADVSGPDPDPSGGCPSGAAWTDISGAVCPDYTPPQTAGTRIYRLKVMNRNGSGSKTANGDRLAVDYSECVRVTYFDYTSTIESAVCGGSGFEGVAYTFSISTEPELDGVVNQVDVVWSVSPSTGVTIVDNGYSADITFPSTGSYTVTATVQDACGGADATTSCAVNVEPSSCGFLYVAASGSDANSGGPGDPKATLEGALAVATGGANYIRIEGTTFNTSNKLSLASDITIEGGWEYLGGTTWRKNSILRTTINSSYSESISTDIGHYMGMESNGDNNWYMMDIDLNTADWGANVTTSNNKGFGYSNYGLWINNSSGYTMHRCNINSGNASNGYGATAGWQGSSSPGGSPSDPFDGNRGGNGSGGGSGSEGGCDCIVSTCTGGAAGGGGSAGIGGNSPSWNGTNGSAGASGGSGGDEDASGSAGSGRTGTQSGGGGAAGGGCTDCATCGDGSTGSSNTVSGLPGIDQTPQSNNSFAGGYYVPLKGYDGTAGIGGGGGAGGGGGHGSYINVDPFQTLCGDGDGGGGGGGGGAGGGGGGGGRGGFGGGSTFGVFVWSGASGTYINSGLSSGTAGAAGIGGTGGAGGSGGSGGSGGGNCNGDPGSGGSGGSGSSGGRGGNGANGTSGYSNGLYNNGTRSNPASTYAAYSNEVTAEYFLGCTNSEVNFVKSLGNWSSFEDGTYVNDVSPNCSSYGATDNDVLVYFTATGRKDISTTLETYADFVNITTVRTLPVIDEPIPDTTYLCGGGDVYLSSTVVQTTNTEEFEWTIEEVLLAPCNIAPSVYTSSAEDPGTYTFTSGATVETYQIKFRVRDFCCGWSIPVYKYVVVYPDIQNNDIITADQSYCGDTDPGIINATETPVLSGGEGTYTYYWEESVNGGTWAAAPGTNTTADYNVPLLTVVNDNATTYSYIRIVTSGTCADTSDMVTFTIYPDLDNNVIADSMSVCASELPVTMTGTIPAGGNGTYTYYWEQYSLGSWGAASGTNNTVDYIAPLLPLTQPYTVLYRRTVTSGPCSDVSNIIELTVYPDVTSNTISAPNPSTGCSLFDPGIITGTVPNGGNGVFNYFWAVSINGGGYQAVQGSDSISQSYDPPALDVLNNSTTTYEYIRYVNSQGCSDESNTVTITVNPGVDYTVAGSNPTTCVSTDGSITISGLIALTSYDVSYDYNGTPVSLPNTSADGSGDIVITGLSSGNYTDISVATAYCDSTGASITLVATTGGPTAVISGNNSTCSGFSVNISVALTGSQPWNITYTDGTTPVTITGISSSPHLISVNPLVNTTYTLIDVSDAAGCAGSVSGSAAITMATIPTSSVGDTICANGMYTLPGGSTVFGPGTYVDTIPGFNCDSIVTVVLSTSPSSLFHGLYAATPTAYQQLNPLTGAVLNTYATTPNSLGWVNAAFTIHEQAATLYWISDQFTLQSLNLVNGVQSSTATGISSLPSFWGLRYYDGYLYTVTTSGDNDKMLVRFDPGTGAQDGGWSIEINGSANSFMSFGSSPVINPVTGIMYIPLYNNEMLAFDIINGTGSTINLTGYVFTPGFINLLEINEYTGEMYAFSGFSDVVSISPTGTVALVKTLTTASGYSNAISAFDSDNELFIFQAESGCSAQNPLVAVDVNTGQEWCTDPPSFGFTQMEYLNCTPSSVLRDPVDGFEVHLYPNPVIDYLNMDVDLVGAGDVIVRIYDTAGSFKMDEVFYGQMGRNTLTIDLSSLSGGMYIVYVRNGRNQFSAKIIRI